MSYVTEERWGEKVVENSAWELFHGAFAIAGIPVEASWRLENQYWPYAYAQARAENPWWLAKTPYGLILVGRRKRVWVIEWTETKFRGVITNDQTTKLDYLVHVWTREKLVEYMIALGSKLREIKEADRG